MVNECVVTNYTSGYATVEKKPFFLFPEAENFARNGFIWLIARIGHLMKMKMMNCFCCMVDQRKAFSLISSRDHCQRSSPSRISDALREGFEPEQNLSSGFVE